MRVLEVKRLGRVGYDDALAIQTGRVTARRAGEVPDGLLLLEHPHVITLGSSGSSDHILADDEKLRQMGIALHTVGRGGDVTYHGPGQLVGYPILDLKPDRKDLHAYLRDIEEALIRALHQLGVPGGERREGMTGVWLPEGKVAAIGVRVSSGWITSHGFALNVATDMTYFDTIVPCGIVTETVTSLRQVLGRDIQLGEVMPAVVDAFRDVFAYDAVRSAS